MRAHDIVNGAAFPILSGFFNAAVFPKRERGGGVVIVPHVAAFFLIVIFTGEYAVLGFIEKVSATTDAEKAKELEKRISANKFTLDDLLDQMKQIRGMGGVSKLLDMMPGGNNATDEQVDKSEIELRRVEAIICSMTKKEREDPRILDASRRKRIAAGSGTTVTKVNSLIKKYDEAKKLMKQMNSGRFKPGRKFMGF